MRRLLLPVLIVCLVLTGCCSDTQSGFWPYTGGDGFVEIVWKTAKNVGIAIFYAVTLYAWMLGGSPSSRITR